MVFHELLFECPHLLLRLSVLYDEGFHISLKLVHSPPFLLGNFLVELDLRINFKSKALYKFLVFLDLKHIFVILELVHYCFMVVFHEYFEVSPLIQGVEVKCKPNSSPVSVRFRARGL